jgi:hypothetical protein
MTNVSSILNKPVYAENQTHISYARISVAWDPWLHLAL